MPEENSLALTRIECGDKALSIIPPPLSVAEIINHTALVKEVSERVMQKDVHYGVIPGTPKPTLYQPGAQTLCVTFRLAPEFAYDLRETAGGHREYIVRCKLRNLGGQPIAEALGSCSTLESKYRYHTDRTDYTATTHGVPKSFWQLQDASAKQQMLKQIIDDASIDGVLGTKKLDAEGKEVAKGQPGGEWRVVIFPKSAAKVENPNIADTYNTVLKIGVKRALVAATLMATGASDMFTQDLEDLQGALESAGEQFTAHKPAAHEEPRQRAETPEPIKPPEKEPEAPPRASSTQRDPSANLGGGRPLSQKPATEKTWRDYVIVKPGVNLDGKRLGELELRILVAITQRWASYKDPQTLEDKKLKANVDLGIAELTHKPAEEDNIPMHHDPPPVVGTATVVPMQLDNLYPIDLIKILRELIDSKAITEATFCEYSAQTHMVEIKPGDQPYTSLEDDRIDSVALKLWIRNFPMLMESWGLNAPKPTGRKTTKKKDK